MCGIGGVKRFGKELITPYHITSLAIGLATRGLDATGIALADDEDIHILKNDKVISTLMPKEDLGLKKFQHIHNAVILKISGKFYVIAQAWNPGDFAILEQVTD